jgi:tRNA-specific 2-thiouridylase
VLPVGDLTKERVRAVARELKLDTADKPDSTDICFVPDGNYRRFLEGRIVKRPGLMTLQDGTPVGRHDGISDFTVGQRRGLGTARGERGYVTRIEPESAVVVIGPETALYSKTAVVEGLSLTGSRDLQTEFRASVKFRYRATPAPASVRVTASVAHVAFDVPQRALTPGQAVVFYDGDEVLGGGTLESTGS